ncbi:MAG: DNA alkylation repair protein [Lachnospiraceae bacterium]|nr:DNA alkylation repair protein [Lachnospiraceae bacterium]
MSADEIISYLKSISSLKYKNNVIRMGIPEESCIGVSTGDLRKMATKLGKSNELAWELWHTGYHEAKILAVLLMKKKETSKADIDTMMKDVHSWDLCDHICKNLIIKLPEYKDFIWEWRDNDGTYYRRAVFTLIASVSVHEKNINKDEIDEYFGLIRSYADDNSEYVRKAISWALRELGKIDFDYVERAIEVAYELIESPSKNCRWIGKDALKELETLVKVEGRSRLISSSSAMGRGQF